MVGGDLTGADGCCSPGGDLTGVGADDPPPPPHFDFPQSTGFPITALHSPDFFCHGREGTQLPRSSKKTPGAAADGKQSSSSPLKKFPEKVKFVNFGSLHIPPDTKPVSLLLATSSASTASKPVKLFGRVPVRPFHDKSTTVAFPSNPISDGKHPSNPLFMRTSSFRVHAI